MAPPQPRTTRSAKVRESTEDDRQPSGAGDEYAEEEEFEPPQEESSFQPLQPERRRPPLVYLDLENRLEALRETARKVSMPPPIGNRDAATL